jgi:hypothetical protein
MKSRDLPRQVRCFANSEAAEAPRRLPACPNWVFSEQPSMRRGCTQAHENARNRYRNRGRNRSRNSDVAFDSDSDSDPGADSDADIQGWSFCFRSSGSCARREPNRRKSRDLPRQVRCFANPEAAEAPRRLPACPNWVFSEQPSTRRRRNQAHENARNWYRNRGRNRSRNSDVAFDSDSDSDPGADSDADIQGRPFYPFPGALAKHSLLIDTGG